MPRRAFLILLVLSTIALVFVSCGPGRDDLLVFTSEDETRHIYLREKDDPPIQLTRGVQTTTPPASPPTVSS